MKKTAVVICPGRGTYNKEELGYLKRHHGESARPEVRELVRAADEYRATQGQSTITELDAMATFSGATHTSGEHASGLIYACALSDFLSINRDKFEIVAVTGNSMGWYLACAAAGVLNSASGIAVVNTMGTLGAVRPGSPYGGQVLHPITGDDWKPNTEKEAAVERVFQAVRVEPGCEDLHLSIRLGGYVVFGGSETALARLVKALPAEQGRYPLRLPNHSAFHTPLMDAVSRQGFERLGAELFQKPRLPLIDGRGHVWQPWATDLALLRDYTLGHQVVAPYDFTLAVEVALKEFAPDCLIIPGPGETLGGAVAQVLVKTQWQGMDSKAAFLERQKADAFVIAMGRADQRGLAL